MTVEDIEIIEEHRERIKKLEEMINVEIKCGSIKNVIMLTRIIGQLYEELDNKTKQY